VLFGGGWLKKGSASKACNKPLVDAARGRPGASLVKRLASVQLTPVVQQGVAWAAVKAPHQPLGGQQGEVADAAYVEHRHRTAGLGPQGGMKSGHQGRTLAAGGHIGRAKVGHHVQAGEFSQQRRVVQLQGVAAAAKCLRPVPDGLAVRAYGPDGPSVLLKGLRLQLGHHLGIHRHQGLGRQGCAVEFIGAGGVQGQELLPKIGGKAAAGEGQHAGRSAEVDQHPVGPVQRGAGHEAYEQL
jgi:hypothetical protein